MPYKSIEEAKKAGASTRLDDVPLSLGQINEIARVADALEQEGAVDEPFAVATAQFKKGRTIQDGRWARKKKVVEMAAGSFENNSEKEVEPIPDIEGQDIEIFRAGNYPQGTYTIDDLDEIVAAYNPRIHEAPCTVDHLQAGPAYGWVRQIFRRGSSLFARFGQVSGQLKDWLREGAYRKRSAEIYTNFNGSGKPYLKAVTFLGAKIPTVKGMADIKYTECHGGAIVAAVFEDAHGPVAFVPYNEHGEEDYKPDLKGIFEGGKLEEHWHRALNALHIESFRILEGKNDVEEKKKAILELIGQLTGVVNTKEFTEMTTEKDTLQQDNKDKNKPEGEASNHPPVKTFTEDQVKAIMNDSHAKFDEWKQEANAKIASLEAKNRQVEIAAHVREAHVFFEDLKRAGKALPYWQRMGAEEFTCWLEEVEGRDGSPAVTFGEGKLPPARWWRAFLSAMPRIIEFGEMQHPGADGGWEKESKGTAQTLHEKAIDFSEKNKVSYSDALEAVSREDKSLAFEFMSEHGYHIEP